MTVALWFVTMVLFAAAGIWSWRDRDVAAMDRAARVAVAFACGVVSVVAVMYAEALASVLWSRVTVGVPLLVVAAAGAWLVRGRLQKAPRVSSWPIAIVAALAFYGVLTARMTIGDLFFFWGPKAQHFFGARTIDLDLLKFPHYYLMHPDYPPLVPMGWTASAIVAGEFSWWGAVLWTPVALVAGAMAFRGYAAMTIGAKPATAFATLMLAVTTLATARASMAGGGDAMLVMFETVALSALTFRDARVRTPALQSSSLIAAVALAGAAFSKVEGLLFVVTIVIALLLVGRWRTAATVWIPAAILVASWIAFARHHGFLDAYGRSERQFHLANLGLVLKTAGARLSYGSWYLPWLASLAPLVVGRSFRRAALPLLVAAGSFAYSILFYLNEADPVWWIHSSVERVMTTTLISLVIASAAASEYSPARDGVVPEREETEGSGRETGRDSRGAVDQVR